MSRLIPYIYALFLLLFFGHWGMSQENALGTFSEESIERDSLSLDSTAIFALDSAAYAQEVEALLYPDPQRKNKLIEELKPQILITPDNFMSKIQELSSLYAEMKAQAGVPGEKNHRPVWIIYAVGAIFLVVAVIKSFFLIDYKRLARALYDDRVFEQYVKEGIITTAWRYIFLFWIFCVSLALFLTIVFGFLGVYELSLLNFFNTSLLIVGVLTFKLLLIRFVSLVFDLKEIVNEYVTKLYILYFNLAFCLLFFLLSVALLPVLYFEWILLGFLGGAGVLLIYSLYKTSRHLLKSIRFPVFYLIIYLCIFEIAPLLILVKVL